MRDVAQLDAQGARVEQLRALENGIQIRVASPFESLCSGCADDTEFLDMTPATGAFTGSLSDTQSAAGVI